jgi:hypothetical protein|tara:strand:+ start:1326 stop:1508 length:183 start_codon:yes stop_codon:yes gene_type:complete
MKKHLNENTTIKERIDRLENKIINYDCGYEIFMGRVATKDMWNPIKLSGKYTVYSLPFKD